MQAGVALAVVLSWVLTGCSKPNPNRCCVDEADCTANHIPVGSTCNDGLVCRGNQCIAEVCSTTAECDPAAPYCASNGLCGPSCESSSQCPGFGQSANAKICSNGACVECVAASDCPADRPVCDGNACRACALDSECPTGACGDDGACIAESSIVYVNATTGFDAGPCTRQAPCKDLQAAVQHTTATRSHIVMDPGTYIGPTTVNSSVTSAPAIVIHGGGATLEADSGTDNTIITVVDVATTVHDAIFKDNNAFAQAILSQSAPCTVYRITTQSTGGIAAGSNMTIHDAVLNDTKVGPAIALGNGSHVSMDRVIVNGGITGVTATQGGAILNITNLLVWGTTGAGVDLAPGTTGTIAFATVADTGRSSSTGRAFNCAAGLTVSSSIVWTPMGTPIGGGCTLNTVIAGPAPVTNTLNQDPMFKDEAHRDYHLAPGSPAKDLVDTGPATDFEGDPRPQGVRFDVGADEAPP